MAKPLQCIQQITKNFYCQETTPTGRTKNINETTLNTNTYEECSNNPIINMDFLDQDVEIDNDEVMDDNSNTFGNNVNIQDNVL